jgi:hypothetical protein
VLSDAAWTPGRTRPAPSRPSSTARSAATIEPLLDRPALRADLRDRLAEVGRASGIDVGDGPSEFAMDRMITPEAVMRAESHTNLRAGASAAEVAALLKMTDRTHACLQDAAKDRCALTFARHGKAWRLVGMLALAPGSA